jgi:purine-binding chemotaxis protein CheW
MRDLSIFLLGRNWYALDISLLAEVSEAPAVTSVPLAPAELAGIVNHRGNLLSVFNLDHWVRLTTPLSTIVARPWLSVMRDGPVTFAILADQVGTARVAPETVLPPTVFPQLFEGVVPDHRPPLQLLRLSPLYKKLEIGLRAPLLMIGESAIV